MHRLFILSAAIILFFTQCRKDDRPDGGLYNTNFYSASKGDAGTLYLFIDNQPKGELPYFSEQPACNDSTGDKTKPIYLQLKSGDYKIEAKDASGNIKSSGEIFISKNKMSSSGGVGGQLMSMKDDCLVIGLSY